MRAHGETPVPVPSWHYEEVEPRKADTMLLRNALTLCYDIRFAPSLTRPPLSRIPRAEPPGQAAACCTVLSLFAETAVCAANRCPKPELLQVLLDSLQVEAAPVQAGKAEATSHMIYANVSTYGDTGEQQSAAIRVCSFDLLHTP